MSGSSDAVTNPFSTRFTRPGALPYLFAPGESAETLVARLAETGWCGAIVGPHGSGKSSLLASLVPNIERAGRHVERIVLHDGQRRLPPLSDSIEAAGRGLMMIDGYEQLSWFSRWRLHRLVRRRRWGLVVTSHADVGLPVLARTVPSPALAQAVVERLLASDAAPVVTIAADDVRQAYTAAAGDLRETLFRLYDVYESRRRST